MIRLHAAILTIIGLAALGISQTPTKAGPIKPNAPLPGVGLKVKFGWFNNYSAEKGESFYDISFRGSPLLSEGKALTATTIGETALPKLDKEAFQLKVEKGSTAIGGTLLKTLSSEP